MTAVESGSTCIVIFARAPRPGTVKTRLIPLLGPQGAAALHARMVKRALATARNAALGSVELHCAPDCEDDFLRFCGNRYRADLIAQVEGDLGTRMAAAARMALAVHARVLLMGSDCPALTARHLRAANQALLDGAAAALAPTEDGGYALLGLRHSDQRLFDGIAWGGETVLADTRARLRELAWRWHELDTLWDIDRPEDYQRLVESRLLDEHPATR